MYLQNLIADMAQANQTWGKERIAAELLLKLGIATSPRTVRRYMRRTRSSAAVFILADVEHVSAQPARETLACDFFVAVTATFRLVYVFLVLEVGSRRILHWNTTEHPTAEWTAQQFRTFLTGDDPYRFVVHDRDTVFSPAVDDVLRSMNLRVLKTPARVSQGTRFVSA